MEVTPVWENSTPTRHGAPVFSLELMSLKWTIAGNIRTTLRQIAANSNHPGNEAPSGNSAAMTGVLTTDQVVDRLDTACHGWCGGEDRARNEAQTSLEAAAL